MRAIVFMAYSFLSVSVYEKPIRKEIGWMENLWDGRFCPSRSLTRGSESDSYPMPARPDPFHAWGVYPMKKFEFIH